MISTEDEKRDQRTDDASDVSLNIKSILSGIMLSVVGAILVIVVLAYMTHITFGTEIDIREQGANALLLTVCSVAVTIILRSWGIMKGEENPERLNALAEVEENIKTIESMHICSRVSEYCRWWEQNEYQNTMEAYLEAYNISFEEFKKMRIYTKKELSQQFPHFSKSQINAIISAKKIKKLRYAENFILTPSKKRERRSAPSDGLSTEQCNAIMTAKNVITTVLMSFVMVSFCIDVISEPTLATIVSCLIKVITILISGLLGAYGGYNLTAKQEPRRLQRKAREQKSFISYCTNNPN